MFYINSLRNPSRACVHAAVAAAEGDNGAGGLPHGQSAVAPRRKHNCGRQTSNADGGVLNRASSALTQSRAATSTTDAGYYSQDRKHVGAVNDVLLECRTALLEQGAYVTLASLIAAAVSKMGVNHLHDIKIFDNSKHVTKASVRSIPMLEALLHQEKLIELCIDVAVRKDDIWTLWDLEQFVLSEINSNASRFPQTHRVYFNPVIRKCEWHKCTPHSNSGRSGTGVSPMFESFADLCVGPLVKQRTVFQTFQEAYQKNRITITPHITRGQILEYALQYKHQASDKRFQILELLQFVASERHVSDYRMLYIHVQGNQSKLLGRFFGTMRTLSDSKRSVEDSWRKKKAKELKLEYETAADAAFSTKKTKASSAQLSTPTKAFLVDLREKYADKSEKEIKRFLVSQVNAAIYGKDKKAKTQGKKVLDGLTGAAVALAFAGKIE